MIAARPEPQQVYAALAGGAAGYLTKDADARELCDAITAVARGGTVLVAGAPGRTWPTRSGCARRTSRPADERARARDAHADRRGAQRDRRSAASLHLSTATVKTHLRHIYEKLGVSERAAAVAEAMRRGLLE